MGFDEAQAVQEGWAIFDVEGRLEIQRIDELAIFADDEGAVSFVEAQAEAGSEYHAEALRICRPGESNVPDSMLAAGLTPTDHVNRLLDDLRN